MMGHPSLMDESNKLSFGFHAIHFDCDVSCGDSGIGAAVEERRRSFKKRLVVVATEVKEFPSGVCLPSVDPKRV